MRFLGEREVGWMDRIAADGVIIERAAAIDVGKAEVVCCARVPGPYGLSSVISSL
jgi:hypothetical protein